MNSQPPNSEMHPANSGTKLEKWDTDPIESSTIHGVENELLVLQKMLQKPTNGFTTIGITGVRGIGKSALCRALIQHPQIKSKYLPRIWVSMSRNFTENPDLKIALLLRILHCLGVQTDPNFPGPQTLPRLLYTLRLQLRSKRYMIVLDDAQEQGNDPFWDLKSSSEGNVEKLRDGFPVGSGGVVIVTSRYENVAKSMVGEGNLRCLVPHKDRESFWEIFRQEVVKSGDDTHIPSDSSLHLKDLKEELINKCGGLPLMAKMMGEIKFNEITNLNNDNPPSQN